MFLIYSHCVGLTSGTVSVCSYRYRTSRLGIQYRCGAVLWAPVSRLFCSRPLLSRSLPVSNFLALQAQRFCKYVAVHLHEHGGVASRRFAKTGMSDHGPAYRQAWGVIPLGKQSIMGFCLLHALICSTRHLSASQHSSVANRQCRLAQE